MEKSLKVNTQANTPYSLTIGKNFTDPQEILMLENLKN